MLSYSVLSKPVANCQRISFQALTRLAEGDAAPETLHRLRTNLRRLQAYLELIGNEADAGLVGRCVSKLSPLRTLHVFHQHLLRTGAPKEDLGKVQVLVQHARGRLLERKAYKKIERQLWSIVFPLIPGDQDWLLNRLEVLRQVHLNDLEQLLQAVLEKPRRKRLHALRLKVKTIRYQEEWLHARGGSHAHFLKRLKGVQKRLGRYEELAEFRKLAKTLDLDSSPLILKEWRRARKRARTLPQQLGWMVETLLATRLHDGTERPHGRMVV